MSKTFSFITTSDVHHGAKSYESMLNELYGETGLLPTIDEFLEEKDFLGVAITGDWFDCKLDINSAVGRLAITTLLEIYNMCKSHDKYFIVIKGTYSHDLNQLEFLRDLNAYYDKFRYFDTVEVFDFGGLKTLMLPEEYPQDMEEYYAEYFNQKYDLILGHGFFKFNCFDNNESERPMAHMPIFDQDQICELSPLTIFGHDHTHKTYKGKIFYNGSYSRLCQGEETPKGFLVTEYTKGKKPSIEVHFIENVLAPRFVTVFLDILVKKNKHIDVNFENLVKMIMEYKELNMIYALKIKVSDWFLLEHRKVIDLVKNFFTNKLGYSFETSRLATLRNNESVIIEGTSEGLDDDGKPIVAIQQENPYDFLYDEMSIPDKILKFINVKSEGAVTISRDDIATAIVE